MYVHRHSNITTYIWQLVKPEMYDLRTYAYEAFQIVLEQQQLW